MKQLKTLGLKHVALYVDNLASVAAFYCDFMGMEIEWQPDPDNIYLTSGGQDNLALHARKSSSALASQQRLDHIGFIVESPQMVHDYFAAAKTRGIRILKEPRLHRDGATSFYLADPAETVVQIIHHPPIVKNNIA